MLITSDKLKAYLAAITEVLGTDVPAPPGHIGRPRKRWRVFPKGLLYGQIDKEREHGHLRCVDRRAVIGTIAEIQAVLQNDKLSEVINTSYIERDNLSVRQHNGRLVRKTLSYSKKWHMHQDAIDFEDGIHNFVRVHSALRVLLPQMQGRRRWQQRTPAMAAGLTDHIWTLEEILKYRLPPRL